MRPKKELIRIVRTKDGEVFVDPTGKKNGRGAYISNELAVIEEAEKTKILARHLEADISPTIYDDLRSLVGKNV